MSGKSALRLAITFFVIYHAHSLFGWQSGASNDKEPQERDF